MPRYDRGGLVLRTGLLGYVSTLRQQVLLPGETMRPRVRGRVRLSPLRERETVPINARLDAFIQPLRWLWPDWPEFIREGPSTTRTVPTIQLTGAGHAASIGLGGGDTQDVTVHRWFVDGPNRIMNEWYKWPEESDFTGWPLYGHPAVNMPHSWTRLQDQPVADADVDVATEAGAGSRETLDVRALAEVQARFRNTVEREWLAHDRYVGLMKELWNAGGSHEVDKVPMRLRGASLNVDPRDLYATDSDGLGASAAFYDFAVDHDFGSVGMGEHCLVTYMLLIRLLPVSTEEINPTGVTSNRTYAELVGDPGLLAAQRPVPVRRDGLFAAGDNTVLGYLPAGWQWRSRWNVVDERIDERNSYPIYDRDTTRSTRNTLRTASVPNPGMFRSTQLNHWLADLSFVERTNSPIPGPRSSLYSGMGMAGRGSSYPYPGPRRVV